MKITLLFLLTLIFSSSCGIANAQKNVVKLNTIGFLAWGNIPLNYERALNENMSVNVNFGYLIPRALPGMFVEEGAADGGSGERSAGRVTGYTFNPEFRFYTGDSKEAPRGFYVAPYLRYGNYAVKFETEIIDTDQTPHATYNLDIIGRFREIGGGVQLGYQWLISDRVAIDWFFFGPRVSSLVLSLTAKEGKDNKGVINWLAVENDIESELGLGGPFENKLIVTSSSSSASIKLPLVIPNVRFGFSLGYAF